jgi:hypothetical protein
VLRYKSYLSKLALLWSIFGFGLAPALVWSAQMTLHGPVPVEIVKVADGYQLQRGGRPYQIRGAGMDSNEIALLAATGGNSLRTWSTGNEVMDGMALLDDAARHGITVALCLDLGRERHGFDYDDEEAVARQLEYARQEVIRYKDHPALLFWIIGNELNHSYTNPRVFDAIDEISRMIHAVDGNHPTTTALSGFSGDMVATVETRAPSLNFLSFQLYGALDQLPQKVKEIGYDRPFMITEWGATGHWEVAKTDWGAPIEMSSSDKARRFQQRYETVIAAYPGQIIGSYVFLFGQKQERTPTWYGMLLEDGARTESIDVMHYEWNGEWPEMRAPRVDNILLDNKEPGQNVVLLAGRSYGASVEVLDPDNALLTHRWVIMKESEAMEQGGDAEQVPDVVPVAMDIRKDGNVTLEAPAEAGAYRLFYYAHNSHGLAGHANIPFLVKTSDP